MSAPTIALVFEIVEAVERSAGKVEHQRPIRRARVPGGWLIRDYDGVAFMPDPTHAWSLGPPKQ